MSTSTDGQISYGVLFEEDDEFPWDAPPYDGDIDDWWLVESGWKWDGEEPYTPEGEYSPGFSRGDPRIDAYFTSRQEWRAYHPCPVKLVNYQSNEFPAYILAIPSTVRTAHRGYPDRFEPWELQIHEEVRADLLRFCQRYRLGRKDGEEVTEAPELECGWFLSSYWG